MRYCGEVCLLSKLNVMVYRFRFGEMNQFKNQLFGSFSSSDLCLLLLSSLLSPTSDKRIIKSAYSVIAHPLSDVLGHCIETNRTGHWGYTSPRSTRGPQPEKLLRQLLSVV